MIAPWPWEMLALGEAGERVYIESLLLFLSLFCKSKIISE